MKRLLPILLLLCGSCFATTRYVAQTAGTFSGGTACNGQTAITVATWNSTSESAGDTTYICGTITGTAGATGLVAPSSGTSGSPINIIFDTGAVMTAPYWLNNGGSGGAINVNGESYVTINGGTNGLIQDTCNGTGPTISGCSTVYQTGSNGVALGNATHVEVKNLTIANLYQRTGTASEVDPTSINAITWGASANYVTIDNNTIHDGGWLITGNGDNVVIGPNNNLYNADHDIATAAAHFTIYGNHFHDWAIWDTIGTNDYHHDGIHCFYTAAGQTKSAIIYNNLFDGQITQGGSAGGMNQFIFLESSLEGTACMVAGGTQYIFNNVYVGNASFPSFGGIMGNSSTSQDVNDIFANNTGINSVPGGDAVGFGVQYATNARVENNAMGGVGILVGGGATGTFSFAAWDYNAYENCTSYNCFGVNPADTSTFATWQQTTVGGVAPDAHGMANLSSSTFFALNSACVPGSVGVSCAPTSTSPLIGAGANLYSICNGQPSPGLGALCSDAAGNARPSSGAWDIGAYQYGSTPTYTLTVTNAGGGTVTGSGGSSNISCPSACSETENSGTSVVLTASPISGYSFTGWSGGCTGTGTCSVPFTSSESVTATFTVISGGSSFPASYTTNILNVLVVNNNAAQTTVACSISGTAIFTEPEQGASNKLVKIVLNACHGIASWAFTKPFSYTPQVTSALASDVTSISTTATTITTSSGVSGIIDEDGF